MNPFERFFETLLWSIRRIVVLPVLVSLLLSLGVFLVTTIDALVLAGNMLEYVNPALEETARNGLRLQTISQVVAVVDGYLLAAILLIFALGLYELFVSKINQAEGSEFAERLLLIQSLDDLKNRLANVILLILIVKFFQVALSQKYTSPLDLLYLAVGLILVAGALYLSGRAKPAKSPLKSSNQGTE